MNFQTMLYSKSFYNKVCYKEINVYLLHVLLVLNMFLQKMLLSAYNFFLYGEISNMLYLIITIIIIIPYYYTLLLLLYLIIIINIIIIM